MKTKNPKRGSALKGNKKSKSSINEDSFFNSKRRKKNYEDDDADIESVESEEENGMASDEEAEVKKGEEEEDEYVNETVEERRYRLAKQHVDKLRKIAMAKEEEESDEDDRERKYDKEMERDSLVSKMLMDEQMEDSGRLRKEIASRVQKPDDDFEIKLKHRSSVTAVCISEDDLRVFSASKEGTILHWDVDSGKSEKYRWPTEEVLRSHGAKHAECRAMKHNRRVLALATSNDGRYLASGGVDWHVHLWDTRTREHLQAFPGHRGAVSCLTFRQGSTELFSGSFDRSIKIWNVEDRAYMSTLFGHQSEVLTVDCMRNEKVLAVGRDRSMQLFKVHDESRLIFRSSVASLECCCFISNDEFLTGSDDGSVDLWNVQKKKPVCIIKNAHTLSNGLQDVEQNDNGHAFDDHTASSWVSSVAVCRGSDLAASGAGNGFVRLWAIESTTKRIRPLYDLPLTLAFKLFGQPSSSSCAERNWSTYAFIHSMKRNRLTQSRAQDLVFIHNNLRLLSRNSDEYGDDKTKMWDVGGDSFDSFGDVGFLEFANLSLDEPEFEDELIND